MSKKENKLTEKELLAIAVGRYQEFLKGKGTPFVVALFEAIMSGSKDDLEKLSLAFPSEVQAYKRYTKDGLKGAHVPVGSKSATQEARDRGDLK